MEQEILHLSIEVMREGTIYLKEYSYMNTREVFVCTSRRLEDEDEMGWESRGWRRLNGPDGNPICINLDSLDLLAAIAAKKGWDVIWNPIYAPAHKEFVKEVKF